MIPTNCQLGTARGAVVMSNIFLASSLIFLASEEAGCLNEEGDKVLDDCDNKVHGFKPASLVTNIAVITGVASALFMPLVGAMVDFTPRRKAVGILSAVLLLLIQAAQVGTVSATWFPMAILQAVAGFLLEVQVLASYAYLPTISREVGEKTMTRYTATFTMVQFAAQALFLISVIVFSLALGFGNVKTAQLSQAISALWAGIGFAIGWMLLPSVPATNLLPEGHSLLTEGFVQVYRTALKIRKHYGRGLRWFLWGVVFGEAAANSFTIVAVVYLSDHLHMSATEIGIFFLIALVGTLPGAWLGAMVTRRLDPNRSWRLSMVFMTIMAVGGAVVVDLVPRYLVYIWGVGIGAILGWFYSTESLFFSMCLPRGQEAELSGFFLYCSQILGWAPALLFTILVENNVSQTYGVMSVSIFLIIAIIALSCAAPWDEIVEESQRTVEESQRTADTDDQEEEAAV